MINEFNVKADGRGLEEDEIIDLILENREILDVDTFLHPQEKDFIPYLSLKNIEQGAKLVLDGIKNNNKFIVHFDTDLDGNASGAIMTRYLRHFTQNIKTTINRGKEHGVSHFDISLLDSNTILIIVDSLNTEPSVYQRILDTGAKILILDHHIIGEKIKNANLPICLISSANDYPNPNLCGAGVVFKFCKYLDELTGNYFANNYYDLAAAGIIADMCDVSEMSTENRYICSVGFSLSCNNPAIKKLNGSFPYNAKAVSFGIAPLVNAACRMNENEKSMMLFLSDDNKEISQLIKALKKCKEEQNTIADSEMIKLLTQAEEQENNKCMYFFLEDDINSELTGLMGNKLLEKVQRPLFILKKDNDNFVGSMRATGVSNFLKIVNDTGLGKCEGHELAAGAIIPVETFDEFKTKIEEVLSAVEFKNTINVDIQLDNEQITDSLINKIKDINKISGTGFPPITVMVDNIDMFEIGNMSSGKHLKITTPNITLIKWNFHDWDTINNAVDESLCAVGQLDSGFFGRTYYRQLLVDDIKIETGW